MMVRYIRALILVMLMAMGCKEYTPETEGIPIAVTISPTKSLVERVGGTHVDVTVLIPPGSSPHSLEPTPSMMERAANADLYFKIGHPSLQLEEKLVATLSEVAPSVPIVDLSADIELIPDDAHVWVAPASAKAHVKVIRDALVELDPAHADDYGDNAAALLADISALESKYQEILEGLAERRFIVYHPAWGYLARQFGLTQVAVERDGKVPGSKWLAHIIDKAEAMKARAIFVDPTLDSKSAALVAEKVGARVVSINPLREDWLTNTGEVLGSIAEALGAKEETP